MKIKRPSVALSVILPLAFVLIVGAGLFFAFGRKEEEKTRGKGTVGEDTVGEDTVGADTTGENTAGGAAVEDLYAQLGISKPIRPIDSFDFTAQSLDGERVRLSDFRGKVVFLNFWATWCGPCKAEVGDIDKLHETLGGDPFAVLAVDLRESRGTIRGFMKREKIDFPVYLDPDGKIASRYGVSGIPTTFIIDPEGKIVGRAIGPRPWASDGSIDFMRSFMDL